MENDGRSDSGARGEYRRLSRDQHNMEHLSKPATRPGGPHTTDSLDNLSTQRAVRLESNVAALPDVLWFGLLLGAVVTICFGLVLHMENVQLHAALTAMLAGLIVTSIWMIVMVNHPFAGDVHVSTATLQHAISVIQGLPR